MSPRALSLLVEDEGLAARAAAQPPARPDPDVRGYRKLYLDTVRQADGGCDFGFLQATQFTGSVPR